jgi:unsaturated rhamnogalacturonyl hydrolase
MKTQEPAHAASRYDATSDARDALANTRRSGAPHRWSDEVALVIKAADKLLELHYSTWGFGDSIALDAMLRASERLGDQRWVRFAHGWARSWATRAVPYTRLDCTAPGHAMVHIAERYGDRELLQACRDLAAYLLDRPTLGSVYRTWERSPLLAPYSEVALDEHSEELLAAPPPGVFLDCLHFDPPFFAALGRVTGEMRYLDEALAQARGYLALLGRPDGLLDHFVLMGEEGSFGPGWGRGQGWALLGLLDVLDELATVDTPPDTAALRVAAERLAARMMDLQRPDGHWYAVVDDERSGDESSTAAFMAVAFGRMAHAGLGDLDRLRAAAAAARAAVVSSMDAEGLLHGVSAAVYASTEPTHYRAVPRGYAVPWGQGPAVLALLPPEGERES